MIYNSGTIIWYIILGLWYLFFIFIYRNIKIKSRYHSPRIDSLFFTSLWIIRKWEKLIHYVKQLLWARGWEVFYLLYHSGVTQSSTVPSTQSCTTTAGLFSSLKICSNLGKRDLSGTKSLFLDPGLVEVLLPLFITFSYLTFILARPWRWYTESHNKIRPSHKYFFNSMVWNDNTRTILGS